MPNLHGVDTSNNQGAGVTNLGPELQAASVEGWWHKATEGAGFKDVYWPQVRENSKSFRYRGPYHWLSPGSSVVAQFSNFVNYVGDLQEGECIQLDIEDPQGLSDAKVFEAVDRWSERYTGRILVYTGRFYMPYKPNPGGPVENYLIDRLIARYGEDLKWWLPWYANTYPGSQIPMTPVMWQWAGGGAGMSTSVGRIDSNEIIIRDQLEKLCGYNQNKTEPVGGLNMGQHIAWVDVVDAANNVLYYGELIMQYDGVLARTDAANDAAGVFGLPRGRVSQGEYEARPVWDPVADAQWLGAHLGLNAGTVDINAIAQAVRDKLRTDPLK